MELYIKLKSKLNNLSLEFFIKKTDKIERFKYQGENQKEIFF